MDKQLQQQIDNANVKGALIVDQFGYALASKFLDPNLAQYVKNIADCATAIKEQTPIIVIEASDCQYVIKPGPNFSLCLHQ